MKNVLFLLPNEIYSFKTKYYTDKTVIFVMSSNLIDIILQKCPNTRLKMFINLKCVV